MDSQPVLAVSGAAAFAHPAEDNQRRHYRHKIRTLAYVNVDSANGGILRDLSEFGIAMQATAPLLRGEQVQLRFALANPHVRIEATGQVAWTDPLGQAGIEFLDLPARSRRLLKEWLFTQILAEAYLFSPCDSVSDHSGGSQAEAGLLFSASPRQSGSNRAPLVSCARKPAPRRSCVSPGVRSPSLRCTFRDCSTVCSYCVPSCSLP